MTSDSDDVVIKVPRDWKLVRSGLPAPVGTPATPPPDGSWVGVVDADRSPSVEHLAAGAATAPIALARTWVLAKEEGELITDDALRDIFLPASETARTAATTAGTSNGEFALLREEAITTKLTHGVRLVATYTNGTNVEVYDKIALLDSKKTRVYGFVVHCTQECYSAHHEAIEAVMRSFTVKKP